MTTFPDALLAASRWAPWDLVVRDGRPTKVPRLRTNAPETWLPYERAKAAPNSSGVGFLLGDGWCGVDLDHAYPPSPTVRGIVDALASTGCYAEKSYSGTGAHFIGRAERVGIELKCEKDPPGLVVWTGPRFLVMTGDSDGGNPSVNIGPAVDAVVSYLSPRDETSRSEGRRREGGFLLAAEAEDDVLLSLAADDEINGVRFRMLFNGDWRSLFASQSEADLALCTILGWWVGYDAERIDRLFRRSMLYREKWERADYRGRTLRKAVEE